MTAPPPPASALTPEAPADAIGRRSHPLSMCDIRNVARLLALRPSRKHPFDSLTCSISLSRA